MKETITAVIISLKVADETALFVLLSADGTINRIGTGAVTNSQHSLFIGRTPGRLFEQFMAEVDESIFQHTGQYTLPNPKGQLCLLTLSFSVAPHVAGRDAVGFRFIYGSDSQGPPGQIRQLVMSAVRLTDPWYEQQKQWVKSSPRRAT